MAHYLFKWNKKMFSKSQVCLVTELINQFHSQNLLLKYIKFNPTQQAKLAQKFLAKNEYLLKERAKNAARNRNAKMLTSSMVRQTDVKCPGRLIRLNSILMGKVTDIIATSEYFSEIAYKGFEITQVKCQPGLTFIHLYWFCSREDFIEELNNMLIPLANFIRHELMVQQVMGNLPPIVFVRDDDVKMAVEVEKRLKIADFGPNYESIHAVSNLQTAEPICIEKEISEEIWESLDEKSKSVASDDLQEIQINQFPSDILTMKQDVFGVKRGNIMKLVQKGHNESKALHRKSEGNNYSLNTENLSNENMKMKFAQHSLTSHSRTHEIRKWATKYKKMRKEKNKLKTKFPEDELNFITLPEEQKTLAFEEFEEEDMNIYPEEFNDYEEDYDLDSNNNSDYKR